MNTVYMPQETSRHAPRGGPGTWNKILLLVFAHSRFPAGPPPTKKKKPPVLTFARDHSLLELAGAFQDTLQLLLQNTNLPCDAVEAITAEYEKTGWVGTHATEGVHGKS